MGRALNRFVTDGRYIPLDNLAEYGNKPAENYELIMKGVGNVRPNNYAKISNDVARGTKPVALDYGGKCKGVFGSRGTGGRKVYSDVAKTRNQEIESNVSSSGGGSTSGEQSNTKIRGCNESIINKTDLVERPS